MSRLQGHLKGQVTSSRTSLPLNPPRSTSFLLLISSTASLPTPLKARTAYITSIRSASSSTFSSLLYSAASSTSFAFSFWIYSLLSALCVLTAFPSLFIISGSLSRINLLYFIDTPCLVEQRLFARAALMPPRRLQVDPICSLDKVFKQSLPVQPAPEVVVLSKIRRESRCMGVAPSPEPHRKLRTIAPDAPHVPPVVYEIYIYPDVPACLLYKLHAGIRLLYVAGKAQCDVPSKIDVSQHPCNLAVVQPSEPPCIRPDSPVKKPSIGDYAGHVPESPHAPLMAERVVVGNAQRICSYYPVIICLPWSYIEVGVVHQPA